MKDLWNRIRSGEPFSIAEAGVNHLGSLEIGEKLISSAASAGASAIKFQSYKAKTLCTKDAPRFWDWDGEEKKNGSQFDSYSILDTFGKKEHLELKRMCDHYGIEFMSTPFDFEAADYLDEIGIRAYKIASCDITNPPLLRRVANKGKIVMLSTGASSLDEVRHAVSILEQGTDKIVIMHCNLKYPTENSDINLGMINDLKSEFGAKYVIGLSDHTMDLRTPAFAYMLGATVFEKHYTIDKSMDKSADHWLSADPEELKKIIDNVSVAHQMYGKTTKDCTEPEKLARKYARRSIVATTGIKKGEIYTEQNLACKRPGTGLSPIEYYNIVGKFATRSLKEDELLKDGDATL
jgi:sialic acid synthase SpsE